VLSALRESQIVPVASLLGDAFVDNAAYGFLFPELSSRKEKLADFFARNLRTHLPYRCTYVWAPEPGNVEATVTVRPPGGVPVSLWTMFRRGLVPFALMNGWGAVRRLFYLIEHTDRIDRETTGGREHWHVHMMAVRPDRQGAGIGTRLLREVFAAQGGPSASEHPISLQTERPENLRFYQRLGFEVRRDYELGGVIGGAPFRTWTLLRESGAGG
jgi:ribosomal protein S18 acetylase RimI-like enzyme